MCVCIYFMYCSDYLFTFALYICTQITGLSTSYIGNFFYFEVFIFIKSVKSNSLTIL